MEPLVYAVLLVLAGFALLVLEIFIVSFGLLTLAAVTSLAAGIYFAFVAGDLVGWTFTIITPVVAVMIARWGIKRIRGSSLVPQREITANAGYRHAAQRLGITEGSIGVMVTRARPSGRARFDRGECDVQVQGPALEREAKVMVKRIDGPIVFVVPAPIEAPSDPATFSS